MKPTRNLILIITVLLTAGIVHAQLPQGISYQAVARDKNGDELANRALSVRISILTGSATGEAEWVETHSVSTDQFGLFNLVIGQGAQTGGTVNEFSEIDWGGAQHFLKVDIDFGDGYLTMSTTQFLSVPYALYAVSAGSSGSGGGGSDSQQLSYDQSNHVLSLENGGDANLSGLINDADADPANEIQQLQLNGNQLSIDKGNTVVLNPNDADADTTNELQYLSLKGNQLSISKRNTVTLSGDGDADPTNELQYLYLRDNKLHISRMTADSSILDLSPYLDNTDKQQLTLDGNTLGISNGNTVSIDASTTNELQELSRTGDSIRLSQSKKAVSVKDNDADSTNELQTLAVVNDTLYISDGNKVPVDKDPTNELQDLGYDDINDAITITGGKDVSTKNMVNVPWVGFSGDTSSILLAVGQEIDLKWQVRFSYPSTFLQSTGLVVDKDGYYQVNLRFKGGDLQYTIYKNGVQLFAYTGTEFNYSSLLKFNAADQITVKVKNVGTYQQPLGKAEISGFRVH